MGSAVGSLGRASESGSRFIAISFWLRPCRGVEDPIWGVLWRLLRLAGVATPITGFGRLLREH
jgi:hypothetical protein